MTPLELQDALVEELTNLFKGRIYKAPPAEDGTPQPDKELSVYAQDLPMPETDSDDPVPYIIVRISKGEDSGEKDSENTITVVVVAAVWDNDVNQQGYRGMANILQAIYHRFHVNPHLKGARYSGNWNMRYQEDNYYPYYFGACTLDFVIPAVRREDPLA